MLSYSILYGFDQSGLKSNESVLNCTVSGDSSCVSNEDRYQHCGINDCQNQTVTENTIQQYKPASQIPLYVLIGSVLLLEMIGVIIHAVVVPNDETFKRKTKYYQQEMVPLNVDQSKDSQSDNADLEQNPTIASLVLSTAKGAYHHIMQLQLLLLVPVTFYNGMAMSFVFAEITRSYVSCVVGVQWVGVCMAFFGAFDSIFSWFVGKLGRKIGRIGLFVMTLCLECGNYLYCMLWFPSSSILFSIISIFCLFGITDGIIQTIVNVTHIDLFPKNKEIVSVVWNTIVNLGFSTGMMLSRMMCVRERIFLNLGIIIVGTCCLVIADIRHRKRKSEVTGD